MVAELSRMAEKVPGWVERLLIPTLETRIRAIVKDEFGHFEKVMDAKFEAIDGRFEAIDARFEAIDSRFEAVDDRFDSMNGRIDALEKTMNSGFAVVNARIDSLEKRFPFVEELAEIKARLAEVERKAAAR